MKNAGIDVKYVPVSPSAADLSSPAAAALSANPDLVYVEVPNACPAALKALKSVGYSGKLMGIDPCTSPPAIKAAGDAAEGLYFAQPFESIDSGSKDSQLAMAALQKYAPKDIALNSIALAGFASIINLQAKLSPMGADALKSDAILKAFQGSSDNPNFMAHPYTCDGKQVPSQSAVCNSYQKIKQVKGGKVVTVTNDWVSGTKYYKPAPPKN
jgi:branched-chain amino acid transport system substrate-binding protein